MPYHSIARYNANAITAYSCVIIVSVGGLIFQLMTFFYRNQFGAFTLNPASFVSLTVGIISLSGIMFRSIWGYFVLRVNDSISVKYGYLFLDGSRKCRLDDLTDVSTKGARLIFVSGGKTFRSVPAFLLDRGIDKINESLNSLIKCREL